MRYLIALFALCSIASADINAEIAQAKAALDSLLRVRQADGCARTSTWLQASIDSSKALRDWGLKAFPDALDSVWVEIDLPILNASPDKLIAVLSVRQEYVNAGAQVISPNRIRDRKDRALAGVLRLRKMMP